ncbi:MAG: HIT domain-containing protein [Planctomycetales bacterium]|nr:HIT domain-containing protein [Planctomycetales bacterium]
MKRIWAPWRLDYIVSNEKPAPPREPQQWRQSADHDCFLCRAAAAYDDDAAAREENLVLHVGETVQCVLNRYPYNNGHLLVSPVRHVARLADLTRREHLEAMLTLSHYTTLLAERLTAQGFNLGLNLGSAAGAGVPGHLHWHLVPRWAGDHNFMTVVGSTSVIPQSLAALWDALSDAPPRIELGELE